MTDAAPGSSMTPKQRFRTIGASRGHELTKLKYDMQTLENELKKQGRALDESREEAQLAARIGKRLLVSKKKAEDDEKMRVYELEKRCEDAMMEAKAWETRYTDSKRAFAALDAKYVKATLELGTLRDEHSQLVVDHRTLRAECKILQSERDSRAIIETAHGLDWQAQDGKRELRTNNERLRDDIASCRAQINEHHARVELYERHIATLNSSFMSLETKHCLMLPRYRLLCEDHIKLTDFLQVKIAECESSTAKAHDLASVLGTLMDELDLAKSQLDEERTAKQQLLLHINTHAWLRKLPPNVLKVNDEADRAVLDEFRALVAFEARIVQQLIVLLQGSIDGLA
ncbi:hypothetical protein SPRG_03361 [Saprolegnia parasitica CBS 223.65]|uniref:Uncharacterized protein n=1 Tax=Saprolegnia parasitica (strain CBS 223.65) TaxID=695850 RepID=A0A067CN72_SAPPC|nr:hypothetical protein SPRG_03361 [Saprolegnia parasitica CBS 223.65]KDO32144.1 hypothetical protein SPRG_03361 [Saprolegnia parasitica CBS 223.65]|eukprot:XP_012197328.1 hypothetical protein SPRG_03361 [Saprolegnia parasitica CBS 223.65]